MKIIEKIREMLARRSSKTLVNYYRTKGIMIGEGTYLSPKTCVIDTTRPSLVTIGKNCYMNEHFTLMTHDWVTQVFLFSGRDFVNSSGRVTIGDNVSFGQNVMLLKGVSIGDNCFIGAGSVVTKDIPANSIAVGVPCRVVSSLEEFYQRRLAVSEAEAMDYARSIVERFHREPVAADFREEFPFFVNGDEVRLYPTIPIRFQLGPRYNAYVTYHKAKYDNLDEFLKAAGCK